MFYPSCRVWDTQNRAHGTWQVILQVAPGIKIPRMSVHRGWKKLVLRSKWTRDWNRTVFKAHNYRRWVWPVTVKQHDTSDSETSDRVTVTSDGEWPVTELDQWQSDQWLTYCRHEGGVRRLRGRCCLAVDEASPLTVTTSCDVGRTVSRSVGPSRRTAEQLHIHTHLLLAIFIKKRVKQSQK